MRLWICPKCGFAWNHSAHWGCRELDEKEREMTDETPDRVKLIVTLTYSYDVNRSYYPPADRDDPMAMASHDFETDSTILLYGNAEIASVKIGKADE